MKNQLANLFENLVDIKRVAGAPLRRYEYYIVYIDQFKAKHLKE